MKNNKVSKGAATASVIVIVAILIGCFGLPRAFRKNIYADKLENFGAYVEDREDYIDSMGDSWDNRISDFEDNLDDRVDEVTDWGDNAAYYTSDYNTYDDTPEDLVEPVATIEKFTKNSFWVNKYRKNMSYSELRDKLPDKYMLESKSGKIDNLKLEIDNAYFFIEYTDDEFLKVELCEDTKGYSNKFTKSLTDNGNKTAVKVGLQNNQKVNNTNTTPRIVTVFIPKKLNNFQEVFVDTAMNTEDIQGIVANKLIVDGSMSNSQIYNNKVKELTVDSSMSDLNIATGDVDIFKVDNSMGSIYVNLGKISTSAKVANSMAEINIKLNSPTDLAVTTESSMGSISIPAKWNRNRDKASYTYGEGTAKMVVDNSMGSTIIKE